MKIGILTYFRPINYGAYLQAYALSYRLNQEEDIEAEIIDFHMPIEDDKYNKSLKFGKNIPRIRFERKRFHVFRNALREQILSSSTCCASDINEFILFVRGKYDIIIAGSDEIWKVDGYRGFPTPYFLPGELCCKKVSYAASGRTPFEILSKSNRVLLSEYLNDFDYIGVRDRKTFEEVNTLVTNKNNTHLNYDPSFVYDFSPNREHGRKLLKEKFHFSGEKPVIGVMYNENLSDRPNLGIYLKKEFGRQFDFISLYSWDLSLQCNPDISPLDWVDLVAAVDGVISKFYHGICFSIIAGTPFFAIEKGNTNPEESKLLDIMNKVNLLDYYSCGLEDLIKNDRLNDFMNKISQGIRLDFSYFLGEAREEFNIFLDVLREIVNS